MAAPVIGAALIGGATGLIGARKTNKANRAISARQMAYQERMSSTAHQREVKDLRLAGLNPILSANKGASSPGGASIPSRNELQEATTSALNAALIKSQIRKINAEATLTEKGVPKAEMINDLWLQVQSMYNSAKDLFTGGGDKDERSVETIQKLSDRFGNTSSKKPLKIIIRK